MSVVSTEITLKNMMDVGDSMRGMIEEDKVRQMTVQAIAPPCVFSLTKEQGVR